MANYDTWKSSEPDPYAYDERPEELPDLCSICGVRMDDAHHPDCQNFLDPFAVFVHDEPERLCEDLRLDPKVA